MNSGLALLFTRPYWLDEWHTMLVANRLSALQVIGDLYNGSDFAPPFTHLSFWLLRAITGGGDLEPWIARTFTLLCTVAAVWFTFTLLRRRFDRSPALAGALAVGTHAMVISYAFEARFYAPWLLFAAMFAWSLGLDTARGRWIAGSIAAVGLCTTHWFGVVTLGLMCLGASLCRPASDHPGLAGRISRIAPALTGIVALLVCIPLLLGQRASVTERSWVQELSWSQFAHLANTFWLDTVPFIAAAVIAAMWIGEKVRVSRRQAAEGRPQSFAAGRHDPSIAALIALGAMPIALAVLSLLQPVMLDRYAITALLAWAPLVAIAVQLLPNAARYIAIALLGVVGLAALGAQVGIARQTVQIVMHDRALLAEYCGRGTVAFTTRLQMYNHTDVIRRSCLSARYVAIDNDKLARLYSGPNARVQRQFRSENEFAEMHRLLYGFPQVITNAGLDSLDHFVVMVEPSFVPRDASGREMFSPIMFPGHLAVELNGNGLLFQRR